MPLAVNRAAAGHRSSDSSSASSGSSSRGGEDMSTLTSLPREVLKWLLSLNLSYTVRNLKRDFSNGFLFAEILSRYYPNDVTLHSFENVISIERKRANWVVLAKLFKRRAIPIDQTQINAIIAAEGDAATAALLTLHKFINSSAYSASLTAPAASSTHRGTQQQQQQQQQQLQHMASQHSHHHSTAGGALSRAHSRGLDRAAEGEPDAAYHGGGTMEEQQMMWQQQLMWQQQMYAAQGGYPAPPGAEAGGVLPYYQQMQAYAAAIQQQAWEYGEGGDEQAVGDKAAVPDELAYGRAPRAVDYQPYSLKDYTERNYDPRRAAGYWQLGKLGPDLENSELQAKRERNALIKELGRRIHEANQTQQIGTAVSTSGRGTHTTAAAAAGGLSRGRGTSKGESSSCRERAAQYANSIPRPEPKRAPSRKTLVGGQQQDSSSAAATSSSSKSQGGGSGAAAAAAAGASSAGGTAATRAAAVAATSSQKRLQLLVSQHDKDAQQVEAIMAEMQGLMAAAAR